MIREARKEDLDQMLELYLYLHEESIPEHDEHLAEVWDKIIGDEDYHVIVCEIDGKIVSSCSCYIIYNLTHNVRPFALVEYVVTHEDYRCRGYASDCLARAKEIAISKNCYKIMLMTGSKRESTLNFYRKAGYRSDDKTGFNQKL
ncbi:MAG: GNAT family N-acetyltransferase [Clostridiales bacterium]|nr:GNAT family N-acetyltransferase [Clostridiales bacterium]